MLNERANKVAEVIEQAVSSLASTLSTSYGPKGLDKMLIQDKNTIITNDGATIMGFYKTHPIHKILSSVSSTQDVNCGDGTTSVILLIGFIMEKLKKLKEKEIDPSKIVQALEISKKMALGYIDSIRVQVGEKEFLNVALTTLNSKIASKSLKMAHVSIDALKLSKKEDIRVLKRVGGNIDDIELYNGILLNTQAEVNEGKAKALIVQFCISAPKPNMDSKILIDDYRLMEKFVKEEREYVINILKKIKNSGANLVIIQKSLLRESCSELAQHFLRKLGISFIDGVDRKEIEVLAKALNVRPISDVDLIGEPVDVDIRKLKGMVEISGVGCSIIVSGCDETVVDEAERSLNDCLCVIKTLMEEPYIVPGAGSVETGISCILNEYVGPHSLIIREIAEGFLGMPHLLAQSAGLYSVDIISNLKKNVAINKHMGISLRTGTIADMVNDDDVIQPALVSKSMISLAIETAQMLVRIDDILPAVN